MRVRHDPHLIKFKMNDLKQRVLRIFKSFAFGNQAKVIAPEFVTDYTLTVNELNHSLYFNILKPIREFYIAGGGDWLLAIVNKIKPFLTSIHNQKKKEFSKADYEIIYSRFITLRDMCFHLVPVMGGGGVTPIFERVGG